MGSERLLKNAGRLGELEIKNIYNFLHFTDMAFVRLTLIIYTEVLKSKTTDSITYLHPHVYK